MDLLGFNTPLGGEVKEKTLINFHDEARLIYDNMVSNDLYRDRNISTIRHKLEDLYNRVWTDGFAHGYGEAVYDNDKVEGKTHG